MKKKNIIFCGCGGLYNYSLGVAYVIQILIKKNTKNSSNISNISNTDLNFQFTGISGGVFPALLLSLDMDINSLFYTFNKELLEDVESFYLKSLFNWYNNRWDVIWFISWCNRGWCRDNNSPFIDIIWYI